MNEKKEKRPQQENKGRGAPRGRAAIGKRRRKKNVSPEKKKKKKLFLTSSFAAKLKTETEGSRSLRS